MAVGEVDALFPGAFRILDTIETVLGTIGSCSFYRSKEVGGL